MQNEENYSGTEYLIRKIFKLIERRYEGREIEGIPTGFEILDKMTSGLHDGCLLIVNGSSHLLLSAFVQNIACHVSINENRPLAFFSMGVPDRQMAFRFLSSESKVDLWRMEVGALHELDWPKLTEAARRLSKAPLYFVDDRVLSPSGLSEKIDIIRARWGLAMVIIDCLQLIAPEAREISNQMELADMLNSLKNLVQEQNIPFILVSCFNNVGLHGGGHQYDPDLMQMEIDCADVFIRLHVSRDDLMVGANSNSMMAEVIVLKSRYGETGRFFLTFRDKCFSFSDAYVKLMQEAQ